MQSKRSRDFTLGAGEFWFDERKPDGTYDGYRYIKETPEFNISVESTTVSIEGADAEVAKKVAETEVSRLMSATLNTHHTGDDNLYTYFGADSETIEESADSVSDEELNNVIPGRKYRIGVTNTNRRGVRNVNDVTVTDDTTPTPVTFEEGDDYIIDERRGTIYITEDGAIAKGDNLLLSYDHGGVSYKVGSSKGKKSVEGRALFVARNSDGQNRDYELPNIIIRPQGDLSIKSRDAYQVIPYQIEILEDEFGVSLYLENEPVELQV